MEPYLEKWRVSKKTSLSDHRCIEFKFKESLALVGQAIRLVYDSSCSLKVPKSKPGAAG